MSELLLKNSYASNNVLLQKIKKTIKIFNKDEEEEDLFALELLAILFDFMGIGGGNIIHEGKGLWDTIFGEDLKVGLMKTLGYSNYVAEGAHKTKRKIKESRRKAKRKKENNNVVYL
ncbi:MAG: hypothetical protein LBF97_01325 [Elusimicrobiota bacterium]|jgi:hypothetical protein|nr:hypothetical protein [Elusimicrobiota bacterium]